MATKTITIPDPGFTLSEALNCHAMIRDYLRITETEKDAVIDSALTKLAYSISQAAAQNPGALQDIEREHQMHERFKRGKPDRPG